MLFSFNHILMHTLTHDVSYFLWMLCLCNSLASEPELSSGWLFCCKQGFKIYCRVNINSVSVFFCRLRQFSMVWLALKLGNLHLVWLNGLHKQLKHNFMILKRQLKKDATKTALLDGTVHPLTSYVIHYVKFILE